VASGAQTLYSYLLRYQQRAASPAPPARFSRPASSPSAPSLPSSNCPPPPPLGEPAAWDSLPYFGDWVAPIFRSVGHLQPATMPARLRLLLTLPLDLTAAPASATVLAEGQPRRFLLAAGHTIVLGIIPLTFPIWRQYREACKLDHSRGPQAVMILPWPLLAGPATAATVLSVGDRDTIRVLARPKRLTIRLACIDAPNTAQAPSGVAVREYLQGLATVGSVARIRSQMKDC
jgi:endonuclease YncB( thermonuclease family)